MIFLRSLVGLGRLGKTILSTTMTQGTINTQFPCIPSSAWNTSAKKYSRHSRMLNSTPEKKHLQVDNSTSPSVLPEKHLASMKQATRPQRRGRYNDAPRGQRLSASGCRLPSARSRARRSREPPLRDTAAGLRQAGP